MMDEAQNYADKGYYDKAIRYFYFALILDYKKTTKPYAYLGLAKCYAMMGRFNKSEEFLLKLKRDSFWLLQDGTEIRDMRGTYTLAQVYLKERKFVESKNCFEDVLRDKYTPDDYKMKCKYFIKLIDEINYFEIEFRPKFSYE